MNDLKDSQVWKLLSKKKNRSKKSKEADSGISDAATHIQAQWIKLPNYAFLWECFQRLTEWFQRFLSIFSPTLYFVWCWHWHTHDVRFCLVETFYITQINVTSTWCYPADGICTGNYGTSLQLSLSMLSWLLLFFLGVKLRWVEQVRILSAADSTMDTHLIPACYYVAISCYLLAILMNIFFSISKVLLWFPSVCWISILIKCRATRSLWTILLKMPALQTQRIPNLPTICTVPR